MWDNLVSLTSSFLASFAVCVFSFFLFFLLLWVGITT